MALYNFVILHGHQFASGLHFREVKRSISQKAATVLIPRGEDQIFEIICKGAISAEGYDFAHRQWDTVLIDNNSELYNY